MCWVGGFDIIYACQDTAFDREAGLYSVPVRFGNAIALRMAALIHAAAYACFLGLYFAFDMGAVYLMTVGVIGGLLMLEHGLVAPEDLRHINIAFFHVNSAISITLFIGVLADELSRLPA
jgi:4-hydroxybenzoate polyprenyltransferase